MDIAVNSVKSNLKKKKKSESDFIIFEVSIDVENELTECIW